MNMAVSFESILPALVSLTATLAVVWLLLWVSTRAIHGWARRKQREEVPGIERWADQMTRFMRRTTEITSLIIAILILLHGVGITGFPRLTWESFANWLRVSVIPILFILGSGFVLTRAVYLFIAMLPGFLIPARLAAAERAERTKRVETGGRLLRWVVTGLVMGVAFLMVLRRFDVDVTPILAGGAIAGVAVGLGAQDLLRDIISGFFLILEGQIRIGDVIKVNGKGGLVEAIRLRTIVLRDLEGTVHILPNGTVRELSNLTKDFSYYVIDVGVAYKENVDRVIEVLKGVGADLRSDPEFAARILEPMEILGVDEFADSAVVIKIRIRTLPREQWVVGRELRRRIKNTFDSLGIEIPYPHMSVYFGEASKPFRVSNTAEAAKR